ncbi:MAG: cadherin-like beta sandwich domain-containing protein, partial [Eubacteriales bacterium]|nr:cadherin-like beta sandwich domain-containing protein [Eubacteriales bacterium]
AKQYGANYVSSGQDTFYLKKFNVQGSNKYNHQFMTHVLAAASEGAKVSNAYTSDMKGTALSFKIPVYENMPESTTLPTGDGNPNNKLKSLSVDGYIITPTFNMDTESYSLIVDGSSANVNINAVTIDSGAKVSGAGNVALNVGSNDISITVKAANGDERTYKLNITRRDNVTTDSNVSDSTVSAGSYGPGNIIGPGGSSGPGAGTSVNNTTSDSGSVVIGAGPM